VSEHRLHDGGRGGDLGGAIKNFKRSVKEEETAADKADKADSSPEGQVIEGKVTEEKDKV